MQAPQSLPNQAPPTSPEESKVIIPNEQLIPYEPNWDDTSCLNLRILKKSSKNVALLTNQPQTSDIPSAISTTMAQNNFMKQRNSPMFAAWKIGQINIHINNN